MKSWGIFFLIFLISNCVPLKKEVSEGELEKVIDRFAYVRFSSRLENEDLTKIKSDIQIFLEVCKIYRLDPKKVIEKLKPDYPNLYQRLNNNEK